MLELKWFVFVFGLSATLLGAAKEFEKVQGAPPETRPSTIEEYQSSDSVAPKAKTLKEVERRSPAEVPSASENPKEYRKKAKAEIAEWGRRIDRLRTQAEKKDNREELLRVAIFLEKMQDQGRADLKELEQTKDKLAQDVKARLEARFQKMEKEYRKALAE